MTAPLFKKIVIFGAGLISGSFALALRKANAAGEVVVPVFCVSMMMES